MDLRRGDPGFGVGRLVVVAVVPVGIQADRLALQRTDGDGERQGVGATGNIDVGARAAGMAQQVSQCGHAAHRIADQAGQALDAEAVHDFMGGVGAVLDRQFGEIQAVEFSIRRIG